ncbi:MAG: cytochrome-c peroxidase [Bacteroidetes bacterium]|nr:cytochrome-c peroxidase [Bacteroidota bacterium]
MKHKTLNIKSDPGSRFPDPASCILHPASCILLLTSLLIISSSCTKSSQDATTTKATPYFISIPKYFPSELNIPADNPMTVEGVELGRYLFYDGRISGRTEPDSLMSCCTCHVQAHSFVCGTGNPRFPGGHPRGLTGIYTPHFMLPMINLVWVTNGYLWNGSLAPANPLESKRRLEDMCWMAIVAPHEISGDTLRSRALIQSIEGYPELFEKAFGSKTVTVKNMGRAIAQFVRTLISANSKFDRYLEGKVQLTEKERKGYVLFMTETGGDCFHCHGGEGNPLFTTNLFYNNGLDSVFADPFDRYSYTHHSTDVGVYVAPTLRNVAFTAPYMHDGRFKSLEEVINFYSSGLVWSPSISTLMHHISTHGVQLTPSQKSDLKDFILTLTDSSFVTNNAFSRPLRLPGEK